MARRKRKNYLDSLELVALKEITRLGVKISVGGHFTCHRYEYPLLRKKGIACTPDEYRKRAKKAEKAEKPKTDKADKSDKAEDKKEG